jgi:hypothetical protein
LPISRSQHLAGDASIRDPVPDGAPKLDLITIVLNYHDICICRSIAPR